MFVGSLGRAPSPQSCDADWCMRSGHEGQSPPVMKYFKDGRLEPARVDSRTQSCGRGSTWGLVACIVTLKANPTLSRCLAESNLVEGLVVDLKAFSGDDLDASVHARAVMLVGYIISCSR